MLRNDWSEHCWITKNSCVALRASSLLGGNMLPRGRFFELRPLNNWKESNATFILRWHSAVYWYNGDFCHKKLRVMSNWCACMAQGMLYTFFSLGVFRLFAIKEVVKAVFIIYRQVHIHWLYISVFIRCAYCWRFIVPTKGDGTLGICTKCVNAVIRTKFCQQQCQNAQSMYAMLCYVLPYVLFQTLTQHCVSYIPARKQRDPKSSKSPAE